jgi:hypothetical protein
VLQPGRDLDLMQEFLVTRVRVCPGYLERHTPLLDRIVGAVDVGEGTGGNTANDPVLSNFLSGS